MSRGLTVGLCISYMFVHVHCTCFVLYEKIITVCVTYRETHREIHKHRIRQRERYTNVGSDKERDSLKQLLNSTFSKLGDNL